MKSNLLREWINKYPQGKVHNFCFEYGGFALDFWDWV